MALAICIGPLSVLCVLALQAAASSGSSVQWAGTAGQIVLVMVSGAATAGTAGTNKAHATALHLDLCSSDSGEVVASRTMFMDKALGTGPQWQALSPSGALLVEVDKPGR